MEAKSVARSPEQFIVYLFRWQTFRHSQSLYYGELYTPLLLTIHQPFNTHATSMISCGEEKYEFS